MDLIEGIRMNSDVNEKTRSTGEYKLLPSLSPIGVWAFALGTSVGWGSLVVTCNSYLLNAGPLGSIAGLIAGALVMLIIARNYAFLINRVPEAGGAYAYIRQAFGYDYGFLTAWFLALTYFAMFWANATSLPLFARFFLGDLFRWGKMYTVFGYDVYFGEILLTAAAIVIFSVFCTFSTRTSIRIMILLVLVFTAGITICFLVSSFMDGGQGTTFQPAYIPDKSALMQIIHIACISPWAFIGFESVSHAVEEYTFDRKKIFRILTAAVITSAALYIFVILLSVSAYPEQFTSWLDYISHLDELEGIEALPPFFAAEHYLGSTGIVILMLALLALIMTSLIGNMMALSRLLFAVARDHVIFPKLYHLNKYDSPDRAILIIAAISLIIPFLGRTAIGWIVDVTTIGATIIYGFISTAARKMAKSAGNKTEQITGTLGVLIMVAFSIYLLVPSLFQTGSLEREAFMIFVLWGILGFLVFRVILLQDKGNRFGRSLIVWIALLTFVLFISMLWTSQSMMNSSREAITEIHQYFVGEAAETSAMDDEFVESRMRDLMRSNNRTMITVAALFAFAIMILMNNYSYLKKRASESEEQLGIARDIMNKDSMTGVKSRHAFEEEVNAMDAQIASGEQKPFAVAVCDVNGLKFINDHLGHKAGDQCIINASRMVCDVFEHSPVYRIGGDEFVAILTGRDFDDRQELVQRMFEKSAENIGTDGSVIACGCSDYVPVDDTNVHVVFARADNLMYESKEKLKKLGAKTRD